MKRKSNFIKIAFLSFVLIALTACGKSDEEKMIADYMKHYTQYLEIKEEYFNFSDKFRYDEITADAMRDKIKSLQKKAETFNKEIEKKPISELSKDKETNEYMQTALEDGSISLNKALKDMKFRFTYYDITSDDSTVMRKLESELTTANSSFFQGFDKVKELSKEKNINLEQYMKGGLTYE